MAVAKLNEYCEEIMIPIYDERLDIIFTNSMSLSLKKLKVKMTGVAKIAGLVIDQDEEVTCVFRFPVSISIIAHETSHLVESILETRGIEPKGEPRAYLEGYIVEQVFNASERAIKHFRK